MAPVGADWTVVDGPVVSFPTCSVFGASNIPLTGLVSDSAVGWSVVPSPTC